MLRGGSTFAGLGYRAPRYWRRQYCDISKYRIALGCSLLFALSGCQTWQALTFVPHDLSHKEGDRVELRLYTGDPCPSPPLLSNGLPLTAAFPMASVAVFGVDAVMTAVSAELAAYLDKKKQEFTHEASAQTTIPSLITHQAGGEQLSFNCISVTEVMKDTDSNGHSIIGFQFRGGITTSSDFSAARIEPIRPYYILNESTAATDQTGKVDVDLRVQIKSIIADDKGVPSEKIITDQTIHFPAMQLPNGLSTPATPKEPLPPPWFALPVVKNGAGSPTTVTITLTEHGTGSPDYGTAKSEITDGLKNANTDIGKIIDALTKKGGSN
jgi:hypothetical protein